MRMIAKSQEELERELYPDSDGKRMAENTLQYEWIVTIKGNLDILFRHDPNVFVAGDLLWYAVEGKPKIRTAPDALVVFGRPKGYRGSYKQWREEGISPQVVFEILSPGNREKAMQRKFKFYERYGVEEYYLYDPDRVELSGWRRVENRLEPIASMHDWISPRLGIRFDLSGVELTIYGPDGQRFRTFLELAELQQRERERAERAERQANEAQRLAQQAQQQTEEAQRWAQQAQQQTEEALRRSEEAQRWAQQAQQQTEEAQQQTQQAQGRAERLAAQLRALGIDPEA
jgi:Uma2 family endonuclease